MQPTSLDTSGHLAHLATTETDDRYASTYLKILTSEPFMNLLFKRQVHRPFDPYMAVLPPVVPIERMAHTWQVINSATAIAYELGLNSNLVSAGAAAHDTGHVGKGHFGEEWISRKTGRTFLHECFGIILLEQLADIELPLEVQQCIALHSWSTGVMTRNDVTEECRVVAMSDKLAYTIQDALESREAIWYGGFEPKHLTWPERRHLIAQIDEQLVMLYPNHQPFTYVPRRRTSGELPNGTARRWRQENRLTKGGTHEYCFKVIHHLEEQIIAESREAGKVQFRESPSAKTFAGLRSWLYENVYNLADDLDREGAEMEGAFEFVEHYLSDFEPMAVLALLNDRLLRRAAAQTGAVPPIQEYDDDDAREILLDIGESIGQTLKRLRSLPSIDIFAQPDWVLPPA